MKVISIKIPDALYHRLFAEVEARGTTISGLVRDIVAETMDGSIGDPTTQAMVGEIRSLSVVILASLFSLPGASKDFKSIADQSRIIAKNYRKIIGAGEVSDDE